MTLLCITPSCNIVKRCPDSPTPPCAASSWRPPPAAWPSTAATGSPCGSLAGDVGASTQVVYTHFDGLDDLLAEVWREGYRRFAVALDAPAITDDPVADFIEQGWRLPPLRPHATRTSTG